MARNMMEESEVISSAWLAFLASAVAGAAVTMLMLAFSGPLQALAALVAGCVLPFVMSSWVCNGPSRTARRESRSYLRHAPTAIGAMAMSMNVSPSLERAVLFASRSCHDPLGRRLARASWDVLTRSLPDVESALGELANSLDLGNQALRQSLHLFIASSHEATKGGMEGLMEKAHEISLQGLKDAAERYVAGLGTPVMVIFGLGILFPIMLLSIVPLLALTGMPPSDATIVDAPTLPLASVAFLILVAIPCACLLYSRSLVERSPLAETAEPRFRLDRDAWLLSIWLVILGIYAWLVPIPSQPYLTLIVVAVPPCLIILRRVGWRAVKRRDAERELILGLYQLGNRLSSGASLEKAMAEAANGRSRNDFTDWCAVLLHRTMIAHTPIQETMRREDPLPGRPLVSEAFQTVAACAQGDGIAAGKIAVRLARSLGEIKDCEEGVKDKLSGVVDMMRSTSLVFAPIVLGVTVGLFDLTSSYFGDSQATGWVTLFAGIYVMELSLVVAYLTTYIVDNGGWGQLARTFAMRMPLSLLAFISVSLVSHTGFAL